MQACPPRGRQTPARPPGTLGSTDATSHSSHPSLALSQLQSVCLAGTGAGTQPRAPAAFLLVTCPCRTRGSQGTCRSPAGKQLRHAREQHFWAQLEGCEMLPGPCVPLRASSISSPFHSHQTPCKRLATFTATSSQLEGPWEGSEHLCCLPLPAIPPPPPPAPRVPALPGAASGSAHPRTPCHTRGSS